MIHPTLRRRAWIAAGACLLYWCGAIAVAAFAYQSAFEHFLGPSPYVLWPHRPGWAERPLTLRLARDAGLHSAAGALAAAAQIFLCLILVAALFRRRERPVERSLP